MGAQADGELRCGDDDIVGLAPGAPIIRAAQGWAHDHLVPLNVSLEITQKCNIRCVHCYNFDRDEPRSRGATGAGPAPAGGVSAGACASEKPELSTEEILGLMGDLREAAACSYR